MHANIYFWNFLCYIKIQYDFYYYYFWEIWPCAWKQNILFLFLFLFLFLLFFFLRKPGILILDLYLYSIKIQTNISKCNKIFAENHIFLKRIFLRICFSGWAQPGPCGWAGPSHLVTSPSQWPTQANFTRAWNSAKVIKLPSHCSFFVFCNTPGYRV